MQEKILIVEDEENVRMSIAEILDNAGYFPILTTNGLEAIRYLRQETPDLVISDIMMPGANGYQVLEQFQSMSSTTNVPFIFLSAKVSSSDVRKGMLQGASDYITKPFHVKDLLKVVEVQLAKKAKTDEKLNSLCYSISTSVPHELLTPLTPILGYPDLLLEQMDNLSKDEINEILCKIRSSGKRLHRTIEKFIRFSESRIRLQSKDENQKVEGLLISKYLVENYIKNACYKKDRSNDLHINIEETQLAISERDFSIIIEELVDNAFKFSGTGTKINIDGNVSCKMYMLSVTDHGRGMKEEQLTDINPFTQHERQKFQHGGNGLGLATVKNILKYYGGKLILESSINEFTKCTVFLPLTKFTSNNN